MISYHIPLPYNKDQGPEELKILIEGRNGDEKSKFSEECCLLISKSRNPGVGLLVYGINYSMGRESRNLKCETPRTLNLLSSCPDALESLVLWCIRCQSCFIYSPGGQLTQQHTIGDSILQILQNEPGEHLSCWSLGSSQSLIFPTGDKELIQEVLFDAVVSAPIEAYWTSLALNKSE